MNNSFLSKLRSVWNIFRDRDPEREMQIIDGPGYGSPLYRHILQYGNERSIIGAVYNRIAIDVSLISLGVKTSLRVILSVKSARRSGVTIPKRLWK